MWTIKRNLIFSAVLLTLLPAHADNLVSDMPPVFVTPGQPDSTQVNDAGSNPAAFAPDKGSDEPLLRERRSTADRRAMESASGLHWTLAGQRPALAYRFSDNGVVRFRGKSRGLEVSASWDF